MFYPSLLRSTLFGEAITRRRKDDYRVASRHEDLVSHDGISPHVCAPMVVPHGAVVLERGNASGSAGDACRDAAAQAQRAERAVDGGGVSVLQALDVSPSALRMHAQRGARFDHYCTCNSFPP